METETQLQWSYRDQVKRSRKNKSSELGIKKSRIVKPLKGNEIARQKKITNSGNLKLNREIKYHTGTEPQILISNKTTQQRSAENSADKQLGGD